MSRSYTSSPQSAFMACSGTALALVLGVVVAAAAVVVVVVVVVGRGG
jgi:hypothetical protein